MPRKDSCQFFGDNRHYVWINVVYLEAETEERLGELSMDCLAGLVWPSWCVRGVCLILVAWQASGENEMKQGTIYNHGLDVIFSPWDDGPAGASSKGNRAKRSDQSYGAKRRHSRLSQLQRLTRAALRAVFWPRNVAKVLSRQVEISHVLCKRQKWHLLWQTELK